VARCQGEEEENPQIAPIAQIFKKAKYLESGRGTDILVCQQLKRFYTVHCLPRLEAGCTVHGPLLAMFKVKS
jgi:hypothetical protein